MPDHPNDADVKINKILLDIGVTPTYLAHQIKELIELCNDKAFLTKDGNIIYSKRYKVVQGMIEGLKLALQLTGQMPIDKLEVEINPRSAEEREALIEITKRIVDELRKDDHKI